MRLIALASFLVLTLALPAALALSAAPAPRGGLALVVAPPWVDTDALAAAAGGRPAGPRTALLGRLVQTDTPAAFTDAARRNGAWFVIDGLTYLSFCGTSDD